MLQTLLHDNGLGHLSDTLSSMTLSEALSMLDKPGGRQALLDTLKGLGVSKIPERQKIAKCLAAAGRELSGVGLPVVVAMYGSAQPKNAGVRSLDILLTAVKAIGFTDQIILDHHDDERYRTTCSNLEEFVDALHETLLQNYEWRTRPFVLIAHSQGAVPLYALARKLGPKARCLCVLGRRPPTMAVLPELFGVTTGDQVLELSRPNVAVALGRVYSNDAMTLGSDAAESSWPVFLSAAVDLARTQYSSPCSMMAQADIDAYFGTPMVDADGLVGSPPASCTLAIPVLAVAGDEEAAGETAGKMENWQHLTSGTMQLVRVAAKHMSIPMDQHAVDAVVAALKPFVPVRDAA